MNNFARFEYKFCKNNELNVSSLKGFILNSIVKQLNKGSSLPKRLQIAIYNLKKNKNLIITKADKGGKAVIMNKEDYIDKMNSLLNDNNVYEKVLSDPLAKWQRNFNKELGKI